VDTPANRDLSTVLAVLDESAANIAALKALAPRIAECGAMLTAALAKGNTVYFCGNGGSAADAQHLAAELSGRFLKDRRPLAGIALTTNSSALTAIGNDFGFDEVFSRQLAATGRAGDVLIGISTSGNSKNVCKAVEVAQSLGIKTVAMTGQKDSALARACDVCLQVPSTSTPRIQEMHILVGHTLCELAENALS
jgi:D-sedoheptulose 7-phosphate isomerase